MLRTALLVGVSLLAASAFAQTPSAAPPAAPACAAITVPADYPAWGAKAPGAAAADVAGLSAAELKLGASRHAKLLPTPQVAYPLQPEKPGGTVSKGGLFSFNAPSAGTYYIAISAAAWIDVVRDGKPLEATRFGHGPDCSGIRKIVEFQLSPGAYLIQIAASPGDDLDILVDRRN